MDNFENTIQEYYDIQELILKLHNVYITKIKNDIEKFEDLTNFDRIHIVGILGLLYFIFLFYTQIIF